MLALPVAIRTPRGICNLARVDDRFVMSGPSGAHDIAAEPWNTDETRLLAHWRGFVENNGGVSPDDAELCPRGTLVVGGGRVVGVSEADVVWIAWGGPENYAAMCRRFDENKRKAERRAREQEAALLAREQEAARLERLTASDLRLFIESARREALREARAELPSYKAAEIRRCMDDAERASVRRIRAVPAGITIKAVDARGDILGEPIYGARGTLEEVRVAAGEDGAVEVVVEVCYDLRNPFDSEMDYLPHAGVSSRTVWKAGVTKIGARA